MTTPSPGDVTQLLKAWGRGEQAALDRLIPLVYRDLHLRARRCMAGERVEHSLQTTALIHEAYLRLAGPSPVAMGGPERKVADLARSRSRRPSLSWTPDGNWLAAVDVDPRGVEGILPDPRGPRRGGAASPRTRPFPTAARCFPLTAGSWPSPPAWGSMPATCTSCRSRPTSGRRGRPAS